MLKGSTLWEAMYHLEYILSTYGDSFAYCTLLFSSIQSSFSVMSDSLHPHESQHARPPCPSPTLGVYPNSCPLSQWCHPVNSSCRPLLLLPPIPPSIRVFSNESTLHMRWSKYWSFSFSIIPSKEIPGLISFRMDWLDLLAVQGTLKSLLQHHSSKASILQRSAFFIVQLSHPYMTTGKTIALTRQTFVGKVMSLFNMLSRLVITFLSRSKRLLISWLQSPSAVILEPKKIKSDTVSPSISHEVMGPDECWALSQLFHSSFSLSSRGSSSLSAIRVVSSSYLRLLIFLLAILIPACASSSPEFLSLDYSFSYLEPVYCSMSSSNWFLKRQVRWSGIPISFRIFHSLLWSTQSKALVAMGIVVAVTGAHGWEELPYAPG